MLNVAILMGRLTADPELRHTPSDVAVTTFTLAVERAYAKPGAERQTDFFDVVAWRGAAEFVCKYFRKGQLMAVHGSIQTSTYTDRDGNKRKSFEIIAEDINFAGGRDRDGAQQPHTYSRPQTASQKAALDLDPDDDDNPAFGTPGEYVQRKISDADLSFD